MPGSWVPSTTRTRQYAVLAATSQHTHMPLSAILGAMIEESLIGREVMQAHDNGKTGNAAAAIDGIITYVE